MRLILPCCCACPVSGHAAAPQIRPTTSRRLVCRERSIVTSWARFTTPPPSLLVAPSRLSQHSCSFNHLVSAGEGLGATVRPSALAVLRFMISRYLLA